MSAYLKKDMLTIVTEGQFITLDEFNSFFSKLSSYRALDLKNDIVGGWHIEGSPI